MDETSSLNSIKRRLLGGGAWIVGGRVSGIVIAMIASMVLARRLDPADYGIFLIVVSVLIFWTVIACFGLDRLVLRYISESLGLGDAERAVRSLKRIAAVAAATTIGGAVMCATFLGTFGNSQLGIPATSSVVANCLIAIMAMTLLQLMAEAQRGLHQMMYASLFDAQNSAPLTNLLFLLQLLAHRGETLSFATALTYYVISLAVIVPLAAFCLWRTARRGLSEIRRSADGSQPQQPAISLGEIVSMGLPLMLVQALTFGSTQADIWIAGYCCTDENVALFGAARRLMLIVGLPLAMINMTVLSTIPELYARRQLAELQRVMQTSSAVAAVPALLLLALLLFAPGAMLELVFGLFYREASAALMILSLGQIVLTWTGGSGYALVVTGFHNVTLINQFIATIALIGLGLAGASLYGINGLALAAAAVMGGSNLTLWIIARKKLGIWTHPSIPWSSLRRWRQQPTHEPTCDVVKNSA